jgi:peptidoglycan hydrolase-like protein with peptidoglycan-binding domain
MKKRAKGIILPLGLILGSGIASASMLEQLIYNVAGQATNAAGARLGDEIYYGSSRSAPPPQQVRHHKPRRQHKKHVVQPRMTDEMRIQKALTSLGFYHGPIDGAVNSFETRSAIKAMNQAYGISNSASLKPEVKDSLIYLGTLFEFDRNLIARGTDKRTKGRKIQTALKIHGFYHTKIDGAVGSGTRRCIAEYKAAQGLSSGGMLDFEEEYQLISSAKEMNDRNIEETLASLKSMGVQRQAPAPVANTYQHQAAPQQQQYRQPVQQPLQQQGAAPQQAATQYVQPVQTVQVAQPVQQAQTVQAAHPEQTTAETSQNSTDSLEMYTDKK